ncbi:MAG TPA: amino acid permease [Gemmatimonadaceae bacterium]|nr:amino acid permease [Gemmatimonadaceae bacterium]
MTGPDSSPDSHLVRALGVWGLAASIVNVTIGGGIFRLPAGVASALGAWAPLAYVACTVAMGLIVLCFAEAGSRVSMTGGPYAYVEVAFGPFVGFLTGALLWVGITLALAAVSTFFADSIGALFPALGTAGRKASLVVVLAALAAANARGVAGISRFNAVTTVAKLLPLLLLVVVGAFAMRAENFAATAAPTGGAVARASVLLVFAFLGVESALVPSGEVRDPARTVPRAVFLAMAAVALLYVVVQVVAQGLLGGRLAGDATPLASAAGVAMGPGGRTLILAGSTLSMFGYVSGMTLAVPRMLFALARDGFLPAPLAAVHSRWRTPHLAIYAQTAIVVALALFGNFEKLAVAANSTVLIVYAACCVAVVELRRRDVRAGGVPFRVPAARAVPWLALAVIGWILWGLEAREWAAAGTIVAAAAVVYAATASARRGRGSPGGASDVASTAA